MDALSNQMELALKRKMEAVSKPVDGGGDAGSLDALETMQSNMDALSQKMEEAERQGVKNGGGEGGGAGSEDALDALGSPTVRTVSGHDGYQQHQTQWQRTAQQQRRRQERQEHAGSTPVDFAREELQASEDARPRLQAQAEQQPGRQAENKTLPQPETRPQQQQKPQSQPQQSQPQQSQPQPQPQQAGRRKRRDLHALKPAPGGGTRADPGIVIQVNPTAAHTPTKFKEKYGATARQAASQAPVYGAGAGLDNPVRTTLFPGVLVVAPIEPSSYMVPPTNI